MNSVPCVAVHVIDIRIYIFTSLYLFVCLFFVNYLRLYSMEWLYEV